MFASAVQVASKDRKAAIELRDLIIESLRYDGVVSEASEEIQMMEFCVSFTAIQPYGASR